MSRKKDLEANKTDFLTSAAKSTVGIIPGAGPFLSELIGMIIPNQRVDRLSKYVIELDNKLKKIQTEIKTGLRKNEDFIDLIEEVFIQASRARTDERRKYIASIIANGISDKQINFEESKYQLKILQELNDVEIIWLRSYLVPTTGGDKEFRNKHQKILAPVRPRLEDDQQTINKAAFQESYKEHLERLELISRDHRIDRKTGIPEFSKLTGKPLRSSTKITVLGKLLLDQIGIATDVKW